MKILSPLLGGLLTRLRLPWLFIASALGLLLNVFLPDPLPFLDELLMALLTAVLGSLRKPVDKNSSENY